MSVISEHSLVKKSLGNISGTRCGVLSMDCKLKYDLDLARLFIFLDILTVMLVYCANKSYMIS